MERKIIMLLLNTLMLAFACDEEDISTGQRESFIKYFNTYPVFTSADVKPLVDGGYAVLGTVETAVAGRQICLIMTDEYGNSSRTARYYGSETDDQAYCLKTLNDGGFGILGSTLNATTGNLEVLFIRTNRNGDTLWTRKIARIDDLEAYHFEVAGDGSFIMTGYAKRALATADKQIWLFALDKNGKDLWPSQRLYGGDKDEEGLHMQILEDNRIAITGRTKSYPLGTLTNNVFVLITNDIGGLVTFTTIDDNTTDEEGNCIRKLDDGSFIIAGTSKSSLAAGTSDIMIRKVNLLSSDTETSPPLLFGSSGNDIGKNVMVDGNKMIILGSITSTGGYSSISLISANLDGSNPVYTHFGQGSQMTCSGFEKTSDGGYIISGTNKQGESHASVALIKIKSDTSL